MFKIIHVSDLHLRSGWHEEQGVLLRAFFEDLKGQEINKDRDTFVFSGDLIQAGSSMQHIAEFEHRFSSILNELFEKNHRVFCPGNHDMDRNNVEQSLVVLLPLARAEDSETHFNSHIYTQPIRDLVRAKFSNVFELATKLFGISLSDKNFAGDGFEINSDCSVYVLNTALYSFGGLPDSKGESIEDKGLLRAETRRLHEWLEADNATFRILVTHHPLDWLTDWAKRELQSVINKNFALHLYGHDHSPDVTELHKSYGSSISCSAPALYTAKADYRLGYSIITVEHPEKVTVEYRHWSPQQQIFVLGTQFSGSDDGKCIFPLRGNHSPGGATQMQNEQLHVKDVLDRSFAEAVGAYKSLNNFWIQPHISTQSEFKDGDPRDETSALSTVDMIETSDRAVLIAPQLFGLTSLGKRAGIEWWSKTGDEFLLYLSVKELPGHQNGIRRFVEERLSELKIPHGYLAGFVVDSSASFDKTDVRRINGLSNEFSDKKLIILKKLPGVDALTQDSDLKLDFDYDKYYLHGINREDVRALVRAECSNGVEFDEDHITQRIIDDLEVLNIHRTPLNVKMLLAIARNKTEFSPINRTEILANFLLIVFTNNINVSYETAPDLKDSQYALGFFCAKLLREGTRTFTRREFMLEMTRYCEDKAVDLDVDIIFSILERERIIIQTFGTFFFNYTYWIYFFAAHHMYADEEFKNFILQDYNYAKYAEVIEFYSGIDRQRRDLISALTEDLKALRKSFEERSQIPRSACLHDHLKWEMDEQSVEKLESNLSEFLNETELPTSVKDGIADRNYDPSKPYVQELREFIGAESLARNIQMMIAAARALRNSDHVNKLEKTGLLTEIFLMWKRIVQIATLLTPQIAANNSALYDDVLFYYTPKLGSQDSVETIQMRLITVLPSHVAKAFNADLTTRRMAPLFEGALKAETDQIVRYFIASQILISKPTDWVRILTEYVGSLDKDSFYLLSICRNVETDYRVGFNSLEARQGLKRLLVSVAAKHRLDIAKPNKKTVEQLGRELEQRLSSKP